MSSLILDQIELNQRPKICRQQSYISQSKARALLEHRTLPRHFERYLVTLTIARPDYGLYIAPYF